MSAKLVRVYGNKAKNRVVFVYADGVRLVTTWKKFLHKKKPLAQ